MSKELSFSSSGRYVSHLFLQSYLLLSCNLHVGFQILLLFALWDLNFLISMFHINNEPSVVPQVRSREGGAYATIIPPCKGREKAVF